MNLRREDTPYGMARPGLFLATSSASTKGLLPRVRSTFFECEPARITDIVPPD